MSFNTVYADLKCPVCQEKIISGVGFRIGALNNAKYRLGEKVSWDGPICRPRQKPRAKAIKTIGYFNCDNTRCGTWQDCYPEVQQALVTIEDDVIADVQSYKGELSTKDFDIIEPQGLS